MPPLYPPLTSSDSFRHSTSDLNAARSNTFTFKTSGFKGIDGVPFTLNPLYANNLSNNKVLFLNLTYRTKIIIVFLIF